MNLAFLLHIYQPPIQDGKILKDVAETCYIPLIKALKNHSEAKFTLNIPLSLIYQLEVGGYTELIRQIKTLYEEERLEIVNTGAYHPLLTKIPEVLLEKELILNEYGLAYYFGKDKGFEGEDALMLKNVTGVFPPEMAINQAVISKLDSMGYSWVIADNVALPASVRSNIERPAVHSIKDLNIKLVTRNTRLSNLISFKRDTKIDDVLAAVVDLRQYRQDVVVALDGEFFGHHNKDGIFILNNLIEKLVSHNVNLVSVSELVEKADEDVIEAVVESTWGASIRDIENGNVYPMWDTPENEIQKIQWELVGEVTKLDDNERFGKLGDLKVAIETFPIWNFEKLETLEEVTLKNQILKTILLLQSLNSDQFWWASRKEVGGKEMFHDGYIRKSLELHNRYAYVTENKELIERVEELSKKIESLL